MKKSELRQMIKEEICRINEDNPTNYVKSSDFNKFEKDVIALMKKYGLVTKDDIMGNISRYLPNGKIVK